MGQSKSYKYILIVISLMALATTNISTQIWDSFWITDPAWKASAIFTVAFSWGMPLLIAVTGGLLLDNDLTYSVKHTMSKMLPSAIFGCVFWWVVCTLIYMKNNCPNELDADTFFDSMAIVLDEPYNIKYLQTVVMLFAFFPLLKKIVDNVKLVFYALIVSFCISSLFPALENIPYVRYVTLFTNQINWNFFTAFGTYLFLEVWLSSKTFEWYYRTVIYCLGIFSTVAKYALTVFYSSGEIGFDHRFVDVNSPFTLFQVAAIIILVKTQTETIKLKSDNNIIKITARSAYGFIPGFVISQEFVNHVISFENLPIFIAIPLEIVLCFILAVVIGSSFRKLPLLSYFTN